MQTDLNGSPSSHPQNNAGSSSSKAAAAHPDSDCFRCGKPIGNAKHETLLERAYHSPVCYAVMLDRYNELNPSMKFDAMPVDAANDLLKSLQIYDPAAHDAPVELVPSGVSPSELLRVPIPEDNHYNDLNNAERFAFCCDGRLLYVPEPDKWLYWTGTHWAMSADEDFAFSLISRFAKQLLYVDSGSKEARANAKRANDASGLAAIERLAKRLLVSPIHEFDRDPYLLNCLSGTIDLRTGKVGDHNKDDRITRVIKHTFEPDGRAPVFDKFLADVQPDADVRAFIQRSVGYSLLGEARERSFWILSGGGRNGKSIFIDCFSRLLGEYASNIHTSTLMQSNPSSIPNDLARLRGKRFVVTSETEENERLNSSLIKAMAAGDTITARYLFREFFDFTFTGKLWIATNHRPQITDHSNAFWERLKLIPFNVTIADKDVIKRDDLLAQLRGEYPAILAWAVQGCRDYFEIDGLDVPPAIQAEIDAYRHEQDSIAQFLEAKCQTLAAARAIREANPAVHFFDSEFEITNTDLYAAYVKFCKEHGEYARNHRRFSQNLKERGLVQRNSGGRKWEGLRFVEND